MEFPIDNYGRALYYKESISLFTLKGNIETSL